MKPSGETVDAGFRVRRWRRPRAFWNTRRGCVYYASKVTLADGTTEMIGKIVNQKRPVEVLSYDPHAEAVVPRKVVNWLTG